MSSGRPVPAFLLLVLFPGLPSLAQSTGDLWLRYVLHVPIGEQWGLQFDPDLRTELIPDGGMFHQALWRMEGQRHFGQAHTLALGLAYVTAGWADPDQATTQEWRPHIAWTVCPGTAHRPLLFRARCELRNTTGTRTEEGGTAWGRTLRARAMVQYDVAFRRDTDGHLQSGSRVSAEGLYRAWTDHHVADLDQLRLYAGYLHKVSSALDLEVGYLWLLREDGTMQHWLRMSLAHRTGGHHPS
ncbi:MAG: DUF2490 domain-containing protein [Flavobacteriales bacterium]|nr:DUF2490 domain-containing protein [Flavobacteriales bacterium]